MILKRQAVQLARHDVEQLLDVALGQLPTVFSFDEASRHHRELEDLVDRGIPPITGMRQVIEAAHSAVSANDTGPYTC